MTGPAGGVKASVTLPLPRMAVNPVGAPGVPGDGVTVTLEADSKQPDRDKYGRLLRYVILGDGTNLNEELVRKGYAKVFDRFSFDLKRRFKQAEAEAKRESLGLWRLSPAP